MTEAEGITGTQHRHRWLWDTANGPACACGVLRDPVKSKRGRTARSRGNRRELELARALGGQKVGHHGGVEDVRSDLLVIQSKVRKAFPSWMTDELAKLPRTGGRLPALIVTDAPGPGTKRRSIVVLTLEDFTDLHGRIGGGQP